MTSRYRISSTTITIT
jgi:hypothetical protein